MKHIPDLSFLCFELFFPLLFLQELAWNLRSWKIIERLTPRTLSNRPHNSRFSGQTNVSSSSHSYQIICSSWGLENRVSCPLGCGGRESRGCLNSLSGTAGPAHPSLAPPCPAPLVSILPTVKEEALLGRACVSIQSEFSEVTEVFSDIWGLPPFSKAGFCLSNSDPSGTWHVMCLHRWLPHNQGQGPPAGRAGVATEAGLSPRPPASQLHLDAQLQQTLGSFLSCGHLGPVPTPGPFMCCSAFLMYFPLQQPSLMPSMRAATFTSSQLLPNSKPGYTRGCLRWHCIMYLYMGQLPAPPSRTASPLSCSRKHPWSPHWAGRRRSLPSVSWLNTQVRTNGRPAFPTLISSCSSFCSARHVLQPKALCTHFTGSIFPSRTHDVSKGSLLPKGAPTGHTLPAGAQASRRPPQMLDQARYSPTSPQGAHPMNL